MSSVGYESDIFFPLREGNGRTDPRDDVSWCPTWCPTYGFGPGSLRTSGMWSTLMRARKDSDTVV